jgi:hypothetical protein
MEMITLAFRRIEGRHDAQNFGKMLWDVVNDYGIEDRVGLLVITILELNY